MRTYSIPAVAMPSIALLLFLVSCGSGSADEQTTVAQQETILTTAAPTTTLPPTTTTVQPTTTTLGPEELAAIEYEADLKLIKAVWRSLSDQRSPGSYSWLGDHNYPPEGCTAEMYEAKYGFPDGTSVEVVLDPSTVERDDGWTNPNGVRVGDEIPDGRIYIMTITQVVDMPGQAGTSTLAEVHVSVLDDRAFVFIGCGG